MNKLLKGCIIAALLYSAMPATAQKDDGSIGFSWGEIYKLPKKHDDLGFIGNGDEGYMQIGHDKRNSLSLQKFSPDMKLKDEKMIDLDKMPRDYTSENIVTLGDKHYWIFSTWEDERERLYIQEIDLKKNDFKGGAKEVINTDKLSGDLTRLGYFSMGLTNKYKFYFSGDNSKMLVEYRKRPEKKSDKVNHDIIGFTIFDASMNKLWDREIKMPYTEEKMDNEDYHVGNNGDIYTLAKIYNTTKGDKKNPIYHYEILKWSSDKKEVTKIPFHFTDKFIRYALLSEDRTGKLIVAGYYSNQKRQNVRESTGNTWGWGGSTPGHSANGAFILTLNGDELKDVYKGTYEFPTEVLKEYESRRTKRKLDKKEEEDEAEADHMILKNFAINDDGSIQLYGEEQYVISRTVYNGRTSYTTTTYYYNDILLMNIGNDGNLKWIKKIPKAQAGKAGLGGMSFKSNYYKGNSYLFFFDNEKNLDITPDETPAGHSDGAGGILMAVKIDKDGNMQKSSVFDVKEERKKLIPTDFVSINNHEMITRAWGRKGSQIALFTFGK